LAIVVKTQQLPEIIEILDDDTNAFGDRHGVGDVDDGGPRWVGPVAAAALLGLIGFGVVTSASSSATPKAAAVTSTTVATTVATTTPSASVAAYPEDVYYAADPPRQFAVQYANLQPLDHAPFEGYGYELWATPDSSATSGTWFSVATYRGASLPVPEAYLVQAGRLSIAISHTDGGQSIAQFSGERMAVTITSFGWSDEDLVRLATSIQADERSISFTDAWFKPAHKLISTVQPWLAVQSIPAEQVVYVSSSDPGNSLVITVAQRLAPKEGGSPEVRQVALRFLLDRNTPFTLADGYTATAGAVVGESGRALATWATGDRVFTVSATMPVSQLIAIARTVHEVSPNEWDGMKFQADKSQVSNSRFETSPTLEIASGTGADSAPWRISVATATSGGQSQISWSWSSNGLTTAPNGTPQIHTVVDNGVTYVLADLPRSIAPSGSLVISRAGVDIDVTVPFIDVDPNADRLFAGYAFSEPGQYSVKIVGPDGNVRAEWPTL
jgi:hypothetical protein